MKRTCGVLALTALLSLPAPASADWLLAPILGTSVRTATGFVDLDGTVPNRHPLFGVALTGLSSGLFGVEVEGAIVLSVFTGHELVDSSRVLTTSVGVVVAVPGRLMRIRPYGVVGVGLVRTTTADAANLLPIASTQPAIHLGGGVWMPVARRVAVRADVRFLRTATGDEGAFAAHGGYIETGRITAGVAWKF